MNDDISKEYLKEHIKACWINGRPKYSPELHEVLSWIDDVPSAEPEIKERMEKSAQNVPNNDLISRKAAIDKLNREIIKRRLLDEIYDGALDEFQTEEILRKLPPVQPERDTPRKPTETTSKMWGIREKEPVCPKCGYYLGHWRFMGKRITYCEHCGQAIDWEGWDSDE